MHKSVVVAATSSASDLDAVTFWWFITEVTDVDAVPDSTVDVPSGTIALVDYQLNFVLSLTSISEIIWVE